MKKKRKKENNDNMSWLSGTYNTLDNWIDSEDLVAGASLPALKSLMGESATWRAAVMGLANQVIARNLLNKVGPEMDLASLHSAKSLLARSAPAGGDCVPRVSDADRRVFPKHE